MQIGHVQHANGAAHLTAAPVPVDATQPEGIDLVQPGVRQTADANRPDAEQALRRSDTMRTVRQT